MSVNSSLVISPDRKALKALRELILLKLKPHLEGRRVLYLDLPIYLNIGDLLIERGTCKYFREAGVDLWNRVALLDQRRLQHLKVPRDVVIALQGGGNFGDIYPFHQQFRLSVVELFPDNPIVMLPQSVHFSAADEFNSQAEILKRHENLMLFVRDQYSYDFLSRKIPSGQLGLLPDMAMMLLEDWGWSDSVEGQTLLFRRKDAESNMGSVENSFDWRDLVTHVDRSYYRTLKRIFKLQNQLCCDFGAHALWPIFRDRMIEKAVRYYRNYSCIDTDRLHGFILSQTMGIPAICRDNAYGKLQRYISTWL